MLFFLTIFQLHVLPSSSGGHKGHKVMFSAFYFLYFPWFGGLSPLSFWLSRQSVYHMESVGRKTVSSVFLIDRPPPTQTHTLPSLFFLPFSFVPCFSSLTA